MIPKLAGISVVLAQAGTPFPLKKATILNVFLEVPARARTTVEIFPDTSAQKRGPFGRLVDVFRAIASVEVPTRSRATV